MSSTENTGDRTQQPATAPEEQPETAVVEVAPVDEGPLGATPDAAVPDADDPGPAAQDPTPADVTPEAAVPAATESTHTESTPAESTSTESTSTDTTQAPVPVETGAPAPAAEDVAVTEIAPVDEGPLGATPDAAEPQDAPTSPAPAPSSGRAPSDVPSVVPAMPASDPSACGRVDEDGTVYVKTAGGERSDGSWQAGAPAEGLAHYGRRFDDLATEITLLEARLAAHTGNPGEIRTKAQELADTIPLAQAVGDLDSLSARARAMVSMADTAVAANRAEKAAQRAVQVQRKEALAAEAEDIAENSSQWKAAGDRLKAIVEEWKTIKGIDRKTDEALWQRFAAARDAFGRRRGAHFAQLDTQRAEARAAKSELIAEAERLSTSTEWGPTRAAMRALMDRWKAVPRVGRDTDDDLWKKFRGAQDVFFAARTANDQARSTDEVANQKAKEELLAEAEKIEPGKNARGAQEALRKVQERYDAIGHVPRGVMRQLEDRMRAVEEKVRGAAEAGRPRVEPENPLLTSMRAAVTKAEEQLTKAQASGNAKRIAEAEDALSTRREWLAEAQKASSRR